MSHGQDDEAGRRKFSRVAIRCGCWLEHDEATVFGTTVDLGLGGFFLRTAAPFRQGSRVDVRLDIAGVQTPIVAVGTVAWTTETDRGARAGIGVHFRRIASGEDALHRFLGTGQPETGPIPTRDPS